MKKHLLTVICVLMLTTSVAAQNRQDTQSLSRCEKELDAAKKQLTREKKEHKEANDSIQKLNTTLKKTQENLKASQDTLRLYQREMQETEKPTKNPQVEIKQITNSRSQSIFPFFVTDIYVKRTNKKNGESSDYGKFIRSKKVEWLSVQIHCTGLIDEPKDISIRIKIYKPNNSLWRLYETDQQGYYTPTFLKFSTKNFPVNIKPGDENIILVNEWKLDERAKIKPSIFPYGKLNKGKYRIEVWHNDVCLGLKTFEIM